MLADVEHLHFEANGLRFYAAASGPEDAPLVLLLHGFPEFSYAWRHQLAPLAAAGLRVVAPDQRGYGHSDKPPGRAAYRIDALADDAIAIAQAVGRERFCVVGHDWGGIVAWHLASQCAAHIERLAILNAPHAAAMRTHLMWSPTQALKSSYVAAFQLPLLPELALGATDHALLAAALTQSSRAGTFGAEELKVYRQAWSKDGALTAMLNWYRALLLPGQPAPARVTVPTLILWGDRDSALEAALAEKSLAQCDHGEVVHFPQATHWLQHEEPEQVNRLLIEFLRQTPT
jgi:pimeloyl-ACP methyl ester carboxylesterase